MPRSFSAPETKGTKEEILIAVALDAWEMGKRERDFNARKEADNAYCTTESGVRFQISPGDCILAAVTITKRRGYKGVE